jgi:hypothetical protein
MRVASFIRLPTGSLLCFLFNTEDGDEIFLQKVGSHRTTRSHCAKGETVRNHREEKLTAEVLRVSIVHVQRYGDVEVSNPMTVERSFSQMITQRLLLLPLK